MHAATDQSDLSQFRYAVYLIPPYEVARRIVEVHSMLRKQFGFTAADKFQAHATLKGFFKCSGCSADPLIRSLDPVFKSQDVLPVHFNGFHIDEVGVGLDISRLGDRLNKELTDLRSSIVDAVLPFVAPDCDFAERDLGSPFKAHITLAFRDISPDIRESVLAYLRPVPLPSEPFVADTFHLLEFYSQEWEGSWDRTLTWRLLHSWRLERDRGN
ncbi:MAG: 2'-5' RNA ligase family protein [Candidatus Promineifilaceae bacterium]